MNTGGRSNLVWPWILAAVFFFIPVVLFFTYRVGFWSSTDNEPLGLANALNMAYRLADLRLYPDGGMGDHPGIQFYFMSWLALALTGFPVATAGHEFFRAVIDHVDEYYRASICIAALVGALGVYIFARTALGLASIWVTAVGLVLWLVSTPATILYFMSPGFESVALLVNSLFLWILVRLAYGRAIDPWIVVLAGCIGAFAYLNKLSYIYIPIALVCALFWKVVFCRTGWLRGIALIALFVFAFIGAVAATGYFIIGWDAFGALRRFHKSVLLGSELYGAGNQVVVSSEGIWRAIMAIPTDKAYALPLALIAGMALFVGGLVIGFRNWQNHNVAVVAIGVGLAALCSALMVIKHYGFHYSAGVSATLPACAVACGLLAQRWKSEARFKVGFAAVAVAWGAALLMAGPVLQTVTAMMASKSENTRWAREDMKEIDARTAGMKRVVAFAYRVPFAQYGLGFVVNSAGVPRLTQAYLENKGSVTNSIAERWVTEDVGAYVIDKGYFPNEEAVKRASNLNLLASKPVRFDPEDRLIELRTVFLLIRK
jgi:hypothetical protein